MSRIDFHGGDREKERVSFHNEASFVQNSKSWRMRNLNKCWLVLTDDDYRWLMLALLLCDITVMYKFISGSV